MAARLPRESSKPRSQSSKKVRLQNVHPDATITSIHQCVRIAPLDKARRDVFAKQMEITKRVRGESNMVFAWYGTSAKGVESILMNGFGVASEVPHSSGHGIGIHLSPIRSPQNRLLTSHFYLGVFPLSTLKNRCSCSPQRLYRVPTTHPPPLVSLLPPSATGDHRSSAVSNRSVVE